MTSVLYFFIPYLKGFVLQQMRKITWRNNTRALTTFVQIYYMSFPLIFSLLREHWDWEVLSSYRERQHNDSPEMLSIFNIKNASIHLPGTTYLAAIASGIYRIPGRLKEDGTRCKAGREDNVASPRMEPCLRCVDYIVYM